MNFKDRKAKFRARKSTDKKKRNSEKAFPWNILAQLSQKHSEESEDYLSKYLTEPTVSQSDDPD